MIKGTAVWNQVLARLQEDASAAGIDINDSLQVYAWLKGKGLL